MKKIFALLLACMMMLACTAMAEDAITKIEAFTFVPSGGQLLKSIEVTVSDPAILEGVTAADFTLTGMSGKWGTTDLHPFTATTSGATVEGNKLTLTFSGITDKYFYIDNFSVFSRVAALNFTQADIDKTYTEVMDEFEFVRMYDEAGNATGATFDYNLFTPEDTSVPQPLILTLHGSGDYLNLQQNRVCIAWAEPQNQANRPCYVLAPRFQDGTTLENDQVLQAAYDFIKQMIADGKVDPSRVYVTGKSMGGRNTITMLTRYNDLFAAGIVLCGAMSADLTEEEIARAADTPVYTIYGELDNAAGNRDAFYKKLIEMGNENALIREYSERECNNRGIGGKHHDVEIICMEDVTYMEWLFAQSK